MEGNREQNKMQNLHFFVHLLCYHILKTVCGYSPSLSLLLEVGPTLGVVAGLTIKQYSYREHSNKPGLLRFVKKSWGIWGIWNTEGNTSGEGNHSAVNYWSLRQGEGYHSALSILKTLGHLLVETGLGGAFVWPTAAILVIVWFNNSN